MACEAEQQAKDDAALVLLLRCVEVGIATSLKAIAGADHQAACDALAMCQSQQSGMTTTTQPQTDEERVLKHLKKQFLDLQEYCKVNNPE